MNMSVFSKVRNELEQHKLSVAESSKAFAELRIKQITKALELGHEILERPAQEMVKGQYTKAYVEKLAYFNMLKRLVADGKIDSSRQRKFVNDAFNNSLQTFENFVSDLTKHISSEYGSVSAAHVVEGERPNEHKLKVEFNDKLPLYFTLKQAYDITRYGEVESVWSYQKD